MANEYRFKPSSLGCITNIKELIPYAEELIYKNRKILENYHEECKEQDELNIRNLKDNEILKNDFNWLVKIFRGEYDLTVNYDVRHLYERPEDYLGFDRYCEDIRKRFEEIKKEISDKQQETKIALDFKHIEDETYIYSKSKREYDKFQKENEQIFWEYKKFREKYHGGSAHSIAISICEEFRQKDNYFLKTHYCPEYARNRAIVYKIFQHRGWELNDENKEKFKYELLERAYLRMASRKHKYFKPYTPCGDNIDYYENIKTYGGKESTSLAKVVLSYAGYAAHDYFETYRKISLDYIICIYPNILFDLFPIEEYKEHFDFSKISKEMTYNMEMYHYIFEENIFDIVQKIRSGSTYPEKALAKAPVNPPFMLESCIDRAERIKREMRDYSDTYDISRLKFASEYNRMKYEYGKLVDIWTDSVHRMLNTYYGSEFLNKEEKEIWGEIYSDEELIHYISFEEHFHTENDKKTKTKDGKWISYSNRARYERQKKEEHFRWNEINEDIEKEGRRPAPVLYKYTKEGLKEAWEHQLGKHRNNPNWNILSFDDEDKDYYAYSHHANAINTSEAKKFLNNRKKTQILEWESDSILKYTPFLLEENDTIISDDINKLFQVPEKESSYELKKYLYLDDFYKSSQRIALEYNTMPVRQKFKHFPFTINTYRQGIFRYTEEYLRLERLAVKMKNDADFNMAIESLQELIEMGYPKAEIIQMIDELEKKEKEYREKRKASEIFTKENDDFEMHE